MFRDNGVYRTHAAGVDCQRVEVIYMLCNQVYRKSGVCGEGKETGIMREKVKKEGMN